MKGQHENQNSHQKRYSKKGLRLKCLIGIGSIVRLSDQAITHLSQPHALHGLRPGRRGTCHVQPLRIETNNAINRIPHGAVYNDASKRRATPETFHAHPSVHACRHTYGHVQTRTTKNAQRRVHALALTHTCVSPMRWSGRAQIETEEVY